MITDNDVASVGKVNKTHGVKGELSITVDLPEASEIVKPGSCLVMDVDGILTPFFVASARTRGSQSLLVTIDGIDSQEQAQPYVGRELYMPLEEIPEIEDDDEEAEGCYAIDMIGYSAFDDKGNPIGEIIDIDDTTENALFVLNRNGEQIFIPIADEFIAEIDESEKKIIFDLPEGLLSL